MRTIDQQLLGHAAADDAGPADAKLLGDRHLGAVPGGDAGGTNATRSGADDEQIIVESHGTSSVQPCPGDQRLGRAVERAAFTGS